MPVGKCNVGIFGSSGLTGSELIRWILTHPKLELAFAHSRHHAGKTVSSVHSYLQNLTSLSFSGEPPEKLSSTADVIFLALGHGEANELASQLKDYRGVLIDLTMDHRLSDSFVYGIPELNRKSLMKAKRISNPGCFATSAILAAAPFVLSGLVEETLFFSSVTGSSGAGISPLPTTHHPVREGNLFAYKVFKHQHEPEIVRSLRSLSETKPNVILTAHSGPFVRGIHSTLHLRAKDNLKPERWIEILSKYYEGAPFVRVREAPPTLKDVVGSNFCDVYVTCRGLDLVVTSVLDNLVKGAAGQAIQNLNLAMGFDEKEGLWNPPFFP